MKSDRELLELAAKAAGLGKPYQWDGWPYFKKQQFINDENGISSFDALADNRDALWLAVTLGIDIYLEQHGDNPYAATRRAIVRAAAEIGSARDTYARDHDDSDRWDG